ncbi:MAG: M23 family metallopeptidase [Candidatus Aminicenantes bacterium]|nr:M23 family metallopeptidase [Candidatus Aminicenantes bacterium]
MKPILVGQLLSYTFCSPMTYIIIAEDEFGNRTEREEVEYVCRDYTFAAYLLEPGDIYEGDGSGGLGGSSGGVPGNSSAGSRDSDADGIVDCWSYLIMDSSGLFIRSYFGEERGDKIHNGIDITSIDIDGKPVISAVNGEIVEIGYNQWNGYYIKIRDNRGMYWTYCHLAEDEENLLQLYEGQGVNCGLSIIGYVDNSGNSSGPHLHLSVSTEIRNSYIDPLELLGDC